MEIELRQVIRAALRWAWLIALATILTGALAYFLTSGQTPTYKATTTLLVNPQQVMGTTENAALQASRSQAETYVRLVESGPVLDRVNAEMGLDMTRGELAAKIEATVVLNTQLIEITVSDESAEQAARIANAVAMQFEGHVHDLTVGRLEENLAQIESEIETLRTRQAAIAGELAELDPDSDDAQVQQQIATLEDERSRAAETEADLSSQVRSINAAIATVRSPVEVADSATPAREPDSPRPLLMTALGLFLGFLIGATLAAILEFMDRKVRPETDIEELTSSRMLAVVERDRKQKGGGIPLLVNAPDSQASEAIRMLRTHLVGYARSDTHGAIAFANAGAGSLASDVIANLGVVMAQSGLNTVVIDANLREPRQHAIFGVANDAGLAAVLGQDGGEALTAVDAIAIQPNLSLIPAGAAQGHAAQLVSSSRFGDLVQRIRREANVVLMDAPPALEYSDALSTASVADGVIIVGRYGTTNRDELAALAETIQQDGMELLGVVMVKG